MMLLTHGKIHDFEPVPIADVSTPEDHLYAMALETELSACMALHTTHLGTVPPVSEGRRRSCLKLPTEGRRRSCLTAPGGGSS